MLVQLLLVLEAACRSGEVATIVYDASGSYDAAAFDVVIPTSIFRSEDVFDSPIIPT